MGGGQPPKKSKAPMIIGIVVAVLVLCCGGGGAYSYFSGGSDSSSSASDSGTDHGGSDSGDGTGDSGGDEEDVSGDLDQFHQGDCLTMKGNDVDPAECGPGTWTVLKRVDGTTKSSACDGTDATQELYQEGQYSHRQDFILCVGKTK